MNREEMTGYLEALKDVLNICDYNRCVRKDGESIEAYAGRRNEIMIIAKRVQDLVKLYYKKIEEICKTCNNALQDLTSKDDRVDYYCPNCNKTFQMKEISNAETN